MLSPAHKLRFCAYLLAQSINKTLIPGLGFESNPPRFHPLAALRHAAAVQAARSGHKPDGRWPSEPGSHAHDTWAAARGHRDSLGGWQEPWRLASVALAVAHLVQACADSDPDL